MLNSVTSNKFFNHYELLREDEQCELKTNYFTLNLYGAIPIDDEKYYLDDNEEKQSDLAKCVSPTHKNIAKITKDNLYVLEPKVCSFVLNEVIAIDLIKSKKFSLLIKSLKDILSKDDVQKVKNIASEKKINSSMLEALPIILYVATRQGKNYMKENNYATIKIVLNVFTNLWRGHQNLEGLTDESSAYNLETIGILFSTYLKLDRHGLKLTQYKSLDNIKLTNKTLDICEKYNEIKQLKTKIKKVKSGLFADNSLRRGAHNANKVGAIIALITFAGMNLYSLSKSKSYSSDSTIAPVYLVVSLIIMYITSDSRVKISIRGLDENEKSTIQNFNQSVMLSDEV